MEFEFEFLEKFFYPLKTMDYYETNDRWQTLLRTDFIGIVQYIFVEFNFDGFTMLVDRLVKF